MADVTFRNQTNRLLIKGKHISMVIHCPDPHQCHVIAVLFRQIRVIRFCFQPDFTNRFFGDGLYDFAVFDSIKTVYGSRTAPVTDVLRIQLWSLPQNRYDRSEASFKAVRYNLFGMWFRLPLRYEIHGIRHFFCMFRTEPFVLRKRISDKIIDQDGTVL